MSAPWIPQRKGPFSDLPLFLKMDEQLTASGLAPVQGTEHNGTNSPGSLLLGAKITETPDKVRAASHETYLRQNATPASIQHGKKDPVVPVQQSIEFAEKLKQAIGEENVMLELLEDAEHADPLFETRMVQKITHEGKSGIRLLDDSSRG